MTNCSLYFRNHGIPLCHIEASIMTFTKEHACNLSTATQPICPYMAVHHCVLSISFLPCQSVCLELLRKPAECLGMN